MPGVLDDLEGFLEAECQEILTIRLPFYSSSEARAKARYACQRKGIVENTALHLRLREPFSYILDIASIFLACLGRERFQIYIGFDPLCTFSGILLRTAGKVDKVIHYTIDVVPERFQSTFMQTVYRFLETFALSKADMLWDLAPQMERARLELGIVRDARLPLEVVPVVTHPLSKLEVSALTAKRHLVYAGSLREEMGVEAALTAFSLAAKTLPDLRFTILGEGPLRSPLEELSRGLGIAHRVTFSGVKSGQELRQLLSQAGVGVALYKPGPHSFSLFSDPSKYKLYASHGIPIITTAVNPLARELERVGAAIVVPYEPIAISRAITDLANMSASDYTGRRAAAYAFGLGFAAERVYPGVFQRVTQHLGLSSASTLLPPSPPA